MYPCVLDACYLVVFFVCKQQLAYEWFIFDKQKTAYELRISDWSSDVCSSDLVLEAEPANVHDVAGLGPSAGEGLVDAECLEPAVGLVERFDLREVRQSDGALGLAAEDRVAAVVLALDRSEEHTSELQSLMRLSYAVFGLTKTNNRQTIQ